MILDVAYESRNPSQNVIIIIITIVGDLEVHILYAMQCMDIILHIAHTQGQSETSH